MPTGKRIEVLEAVVDHLEERVERDGKARDGRLEKLEKALHGNGRPGVLERLAAVEKDAKWNVWFTRLLVASVLGNVVSIVLFLVRR